MSGLALTLISAPSGVSVEFPGGGRSYACNGGRFSIGIDRTCEIVVRVEEWAWAGFCADGWGGRKNCGFVVEDGTWTLTHFGHAGTILVNGDPMRGAGSLELVLGDRIALSASLVFQVVEQASPQTETEPPELLDAVAEAPWDEARWHVLGDWLIEHEAPHALMAAYELKLQHGTNDPDLIGDYAAIRRQRHRLGDLRNDHLVWKCGYVVSCSIWLGPRDASESIRLARAFAGPQFAATSRLTLQCNGTESAARLEGVLAVLPKTLRVVGLEFSAAVPSASLMALKNRPPKAHTVRLHLADPLGPLGPLVDVLVASGWQTIDFEGTRLTDRSYELRQLLRKHSATRFVLGGTWLGGQTVRSLQLDNARWASLEHDALLIDLESGAVLPLSRSRKDFSWGLPLRPLGSGWAGIGRHNDGALTSGDRIVGSGRTFVFLTGGSLHDEYLAWLRSWAPPEP